jgi:excinuclease ABC subunit C
MNLLTLKKKIAKLYKSPGVYIFKDKNGRILYIGKAASLRSRVGSYFSQLHDANQRINANQRIANRPIEAMIHQVADIETRQTDSVLEALILESHLIKKYQPKYNAMGKDDKSFAYFVITKEEFPRVLILRKNELENKFKYVIPSLSRNLLKTKEKLDPSTPLRSAQDDINVNKIYGPYTSRKQMEIALKIMRKIFPFHNLAQHSEKGCLDFQIGTCPGPYAGAISEADYMKNIRGIKMILEGKKKSLVKKLENEMQEYSKNHEFEKAANIRNKIFALKHIQDIALISKETPLPQSLSSRGASEDMERFSRIEAYDISNIFGKYATGSMIVFTNGQVDKSEYRKFKIKTIEGINDVEMMKEVLRRRLRHKEWPFPDLILIDGGLGQYNGAREVIKEVGVDIPVVALAKGPTRKGEKIFSSIPLKMDVNFLKAIRDEAHRFAIWYHRKLRKKGLFS